MNVCSITHSSQETKPPCCELTFDYDPRAGSTSNSESTCAGHYLHLERCLKHIYYSKSVPLKLPTCKARDAASATWFRQKHHFEVCTWDLWVCHIFPSHHVLHVLLPNYIQQDTQNGFHDFQKHFRMTLWPAFIGYHKSICSCFEVHSWFLPHFKHSINARHNVVCRKGLNALSEGLALDKRKDSTGGRKLSVQLMVEQRETCNLISQTAVN